MVSFNILAGGFGTFIINYLFNSDAGTLTVQNKFDGIGENPSWIALHLMNKSIL